MLTYCVTIQSVQSADSLLFGIIILYPKRKFTVSRLWLKIWICNRVIHQLAQYKAVSQVSIKLLKRS